MAASHTISTVFVSLNVMWEGGPWKCQNVFQPQSITPTEQTAPFPDWFSNGPKFPFSSRASILSYNQRSSVLLYPRLSRHCSSCFCPSYLQISVCFLFSPCTLWSTETMDSVLACAQFIANRVQREFLYCPHLLHFSCIQFSEFSSNCMQYMIRLNYSWPMCKIFGLSVSLM